MATPKLGEKATAIPTSASEPAFAPNSRLVSLLAALISAWIAAGSTGLVGHGLRHALALFFLGVAFLPVLPTMASPFSVKRALTLGSVMAIALWLIGSPDPPANVAASAFVLAAMAWLRPGPERKEFLVASTAILALALWRFAVTALPWLWLIIDRTAMVTSSAVGFVGRQPLKTGMTYGGTDFLVLMLTLVGLWASGQPRFNVGRVAKMIGAVLGAHLLYLIALSYAPKVLTLLPAPPAANVEPIFGQRAPWDWSQAVRSVVPWNVPVLALLLQLPVAAWLFRALRRGEPPPAGAGQHEMRGLSRLGGSRFITIVLPVGLALLVPALACLNLRPLSLAGKKIVVYEKGFLNWMKPKHGEYGRLSVGMYGMLPEFLQCYGATCVVSPELAPADLQGADLLVVIFPNKPWAEGQLERIWSFVREGGSLLILGEHTVREKDGSNRFNDILGPTALRVAFDSAMFEVGGWLESYEALAHPATAGVHDFRNEFGVVIGASVEAHWPARPFLAGRFGFSDPGDPTNDESKGGSMMGNHKYDAGEKLGDQLLAAEQRFGRGRVMVFGDTSGFSNSILFGSHDFIARLYAYLCSDVEVSFLRTFAGGVGVLIILISLMGGLQPAGLMGTAAALGIGLLCTTQGNHGKADVLPHGQPITPTGFNRLAYIDTSHFLRTSSESWRDDGLGGLELTLMRNGYVVLGLDRFDPDRLEGAGLLILSAPSRPFSAAEIEAVRRFIDGGGIFICTAGWPEAGASRKLLADLGFFVGGIGAATTGQPEPKPFGHFKAPYFNGGDYMAYVRFNAAWNVESSDPQARPLAYGPRDPKGSPDQSDPSVILMRRIGRGKAVVIADSDFATNKNLEREGGQPFEGMRENADFWRWLLEYLNDRPAWTPPRPLPPAELTYTNRVLQ